MKLFNQLLKELDSFDDIIKNKRTIPTTKTINAGYEKNRISGEQQPDIKVRYKGVMELAAKHNMSPKEMIKTLFSRATDIKQQAYSRDNPIQRTAASIAAKAKAVGRKVQVQRAHNKPYSTIYIKTKDQNNEPIEIRVADHSPKLYKGKTPVGGFNKTTGERIDISKRNRIYVRADNPKSLIPNIELTPKQVRKILFNEELLEGLDKILDVILNRAPDSKRFDLLNRRLYKKYGSGEVRHGSSRTVIKDSTPHKIILDGKKTSIPAVYKISRYNPQIDNNMKHLGSSMGDFQNMVESRPHFEKHRVLQKQKDGSYKTNPNGFLLPIFHRHPLGHFTHTAEIEPLFDINSHHELFQKLTKTNSHPNGISYNEFYKAIDPHYKKRQAGIYKHVLKALGPDNPHTKIEKRLLDISDHPFVKAVRDFSKESKIVHSDYELSNIGIFTHPHTKKKQLVLSDTGFSHGVSRYYNKAQQSSYKDIT